MKRLLSIGIALSTALTFMPVTNVVAMSGQTTTADTAFTVSSAKGVYYKITLNAKSLLSFKIETDKDAYPVFNLYNAKGKEAEPLESVSDTEHIYSKGNYYLHYSNDNDDTKASTAFTSKKHMFFYDISKKKESYIKNIQNKPKTYTLKAGNYYLNCMALSDPGYDVYAHYDFTIKG